MDMVALLRQFIEAERTGNWELYLQSLRDMLPFYAGAGHNLYVKYVYIYLQQMLELNSKHGDVLAVFKKGFPQNSSERSFLGRTIFRPGH